MPTIFFMQFCITVNCLFVTKQVFVPGSFQCTLLFSALCVEQTIIFLNSSNLVCFQFLWALT